MSRRVDGTEKRAVRKDEEVEANQKGSEELEDWQKI